MTHFTVFRPLFQQVRRTHWLLLGGAALLVGCTDGAPGSGQRIVFDETERELFVQPIQVCNDSGNNCAQVNLFADITAKILEQARLRVNFLPTRQLNASRFLTIDSQSSSGSSEFYELSRSGSNSTYGRHPDSTRTSGPINAWFVRSIESTPGFTQFGSAWVGANGVLISEATQSFNGGRGRIDTLAHEIGHNLGLQHTSHGAGGGNNLLTDGNNRNIPGGIGDIYPDGAGLSQLTLEQLTEIVNSPLVSEISSDTAASDTVASDAAALAMSDMASLSLASLQLQASEAKDISKIPESSSTQAIALIGFSALLVLKKRTEKSGQTIVETERSLSH